MQAGSRVARDGTPARPRCPAGRGRLPDVHACRAAEDGNGQSGASLDQVRAIVGAPAAPVGLKKATKPEGGCRSEFSTRARKQTRSARAEDRRAARSTTPMLIAAGQCLGQARATEVLPIPPGSPRWLSNAGMATEPRHWPIISSARPSDRTGAQSAGCIDTKLRWAFRDRGWGDETIGAPRDIDQVPITATQHSPQRADLEHEVALLRQKCATGRGPSARPCRPLRPDARPR